jgi:cobaltochelatase CobT
MSNEERAVQALQDQVGSALLRVLSGDASLQWSAQTLYRGTQQIPLLSPHQNEVPQSLQAQRGLLDGAALRLRLSDVALHQQLVPADPIEQLVFELLEQLRVESLSPANWPGVQANLQQRFERWAQEFVDSGLTETSLGILLFTLALMVWSRLGGHALPERMADLMEATRAHLASEIGPCLQALRRYRRDQAAYAQQALLLVRWVGQAICHAQAEVPNGAARARRRNGFALRLLPPPSVMHPWLEASSASSSTWQASAQQYRVFSTRHDREVAASTLVRPAQLQALRTQMDQEVQQAAYPLQRLSRLLRQALARPQRTGWQSGQEWGYLDAARLSQLVCDPQHRAIFKDQQPQPVMRCAVTLLFDCSGSMKAHALRMSLLADVLGRALSMAGASVEILGFSTSAWNGGRTLREWSRAGRPQMPGRLNERLHLVFKSAQQPWRQGRLGLAALRRPDLFREGLDGEAVQWACERLRAQPVLQRYLVVVSDGCPMDSATAQANDAHYLDEHLRQVVTTELSRGQVRILGLGLGLDLGLFYPHRLALDTETSTLDEATLWAVAQALLSEIGATNQYETVQ